MGARSDGRSAPLLAPTPCCLHLLLQEDGWGRCQCAQLQREARGCDYVTCLHRRAGAVMYGPSAASPLISFIYPMINIQS
uniref:Uncharacterized protein n=1 Tax=Knipowitschia caucasica TaxID=637954 RepID=A0AAV2MCV2_KNICA